ncbi:MAG TPA: CdaR family protein [Sphingobacteriaceae bacterium]
MDMPFIRLSKNQRRKVAVFFTCLAIAVFAWLFFALSNQYEYTIKTKVDYINLPQNKAFHPLQSDTVTLKIEGTGWKLLFSRINLIPETIKVNLKSLSRRNFVTFSEQLSDINKRFHSTHRVISVMPDTLYFDFSSRSVKKVPVKLLYKINFKPGFGISDSIEVLPNYITVTGPIEDIEDIKAWGTDTIQVDGVNNTVNARVAMKSPSNNVTIYPSMVEVKVPVSEFTEKSFDLPVSIINNEKNIDVKLLPSKVRVTFLISLNDFANIVRDDFVAVIDLHDWSEKQYKQLPVIIKKCPAFCKIVRVEPQMVDFIIEQ